MDEAVMHSLFDTLAMLFVHCCGHVQFDLKIIKSLLLPTKPGQCIHLTAKKSQTNVIGKEKT